jgi:CRISPR-associated protein Cas1
MIKKTLVFSNPAYLSYKDKQLIIDIRKFSSQDEENSDELNVDRYKLNKSIAIEDVEIVIIDHYGVVISQFLLSSLLENNVAVIICNQSHLPNGLFLNLDGNQVQSENFKNQINSSIPLKKQLWQQTIFAKISNQTELLRKKGIPAENMIKWAKNVKSGDPDNLEARAANYYWKKLFPEELEFTRDRFGFPPNNLLNYGYAILRAITARSLVASGLLPTLGIHHHNKYNAYCLADDIMEPYRPFIDSIVLDIVNSGEDFNELSTNMKKKLLEIATYDVFIKGERNPLMIGMQRTSSSLAKCFEKDTRKIYFPEFVPHLILNKKRKFY